MVFCQRLSSGSTAVCAVVERDVLHVAWLGDSQALLVRDRKPIRLVTPHKPEQEASTCILHINEKKTNPCARTALFRDILRELVADSVKRKTNRPMILLY